MDMIELAIAKRFLRQDVRQKSSLQIGSESESGSRGAGVGPNRVPGLAELRRRVVILKL